MHPPDQYVVGDFDGDGRSELLAINPDNGWSHLMRYDGSGWQTPWDNDGSGTIHWWQLRPPDQYVVGDFDGDNHSELLAINTENGWAHLMRYDGSDWQTPWGNDGDATIHLWRMQPGDRYRAGRFDAGPAVLLALGLNGWCQLLSYHLL
jgi:hypothetical protein